MKLETQSLWHLNFKNDSIIFTEPVKLLIWSIFICLFTSFSEKPWHLRLYFKSPCILPSTPMIIGINWLEYSRYKICRLCNSGSYVFSFSWIFRVTFISPGQLNSTTWHSFECRSHIIRSGRLFLRFVTVLTLTFHQNSFFFRCFNEFIGIYIFQAKLSAFWKLSAKYNS